MPIERTFTVTLENTVCNTIGSRLNIFGMRACKWPFQKYIPYLANLITLPKALSPSTGYTRAHLNPVPRYHHVLSRKPSVNVRYRCSLSYPQNDARRTCGSVSLLEIRSKGCPARHSLLGTLCQRQSVCSRAEQSSQVQKPRRHHTITASLSKLLLDSISA